MVGQVSADFPPERVKLIRSLLNMTQSEFAATYALGKNTVGRLEAGTEWISGPVTNKLLKAAQDAGA